MSDIHKQLCDLLDREGATYRVIEHEPEGRTEVIAKIRGNRIEQSIKSIVVQVRLNRKENIYCLANVPAIVASTLLESNVTSTPTVSRLPRAKRPRS